MANATTIITRALRELQVYPESQTLDPDDSAACLLALNNLANSWLTGPNYSFTSNRVTATLGSGSRTMTIGPGKDFNVPRPIRLEDGCFATIGTIDYPLRVIEEGEYLSIPLKDVQGPWPSVCYYDAGFPTGLVYFWPLGTCPITLNLQTQIASFPDLNTDVVLPPGYERAFSLTLAEEVAPMYAATPSPMTLRNAKAARRDIKRANLLVPELEPDPRLGNATLPLVSTPSFDGVRDNT